MVPEPRSQDRPASCFGDLLEIAAGYRQELSDDQFPYVAEHIDYHLSEPEDEQSEFAFGLGLILDGLERIRNAF